MFTKAASGKPMTKLIMEKAFYVQQWEVGIKTKKQHSKSFKKMYVFIIAAILSNFIGRFLKGIFMLF